ncbi:hypothetical protein NCCP2716_13740 [Sporosarcina sp. NCCP-2716]|uniref:hypothetical protein n=1 Tax=Sporosarcina sp. NCCP-2716 TaxID=2943679 RepID=UPI00203D9D3C|nr:hypothetical protein [Sporosarcina sp. NCCP-2716]GKV68876.1 hypothetical protein NCCP2716_13740 [Sporosarcina sp. NCCP-2716]
MAFGIDRKELKAWKQRVAAGEIAFLTHYWLDDRFPGCKTVTKAGCSDVDKLKAWGRNYGLKPEWIDYKEDFPHFDLFGKVELQALLDADLEEQAQRFRLV